jgi:hypothetical protein
MPKFKIIRDRIQLSDIRFDYYLDEALSFFKKLESLVGSPPPVALIDTKEFVEWQNKLWKEFSEAIENCRHKIQAINYNISLIESEINNPPIPQFESLPADLDEKEFLNDVVLFEFESFLFQIASSLDVLVHLLKLFYPILNNKEHKIGFNGKLGIAGKETVNILRNSGEKKLADYIESQVETWIQKVYDLRNMVAHRSRVYSLQMFLIDKNGLSAPRFSNSEISLLEYCKETYGNLKKFLNCIENDFLLFKPESFYKIL